MINLEPKLNPARGAAMLQAHNRANREGKPMFVFVGPPGSGCFRNDGFNVWFVRSVEEGVPDKAELIHTQAPNMSCGYAPL